MQTAFWVISMITTLGVLRRIWMTRRPDAKKDKPIYIVEVGAGHGKLGFLILNHLEELAEFMPEGTRIGMLLIR